MTGAKAETGLIHSFFTKRWRRQDLINVIQYVSNCALS